MQIANTIRTVFMQLQETLAELTPQQYTQPSKILFNATIGQHVRHIAELFQCLNIGYETGTVNYDKRKRDRLIETDKELAAGMLHAIYEALDKPDKQLALEVNCNDRLQVVATNYHREVVYNLEHTVHHMALIRVGVTEVSDIQLPEDFGVASSTIKHRAACAQ